MIILSVNMTNYQLSIACGHLSGNGVDEIAKEQLQQRRKDPQNYTEIYRMHKMPKKLNTFNLSERS